MVDTITVLLWLRFLFFVNWIRPEVVIIVSFANSPFEVLLEIVKIFYWWRRWHGRGSCRKECVRVVSFCNEKADPSWRFVADTVHEVASSFPKSNKRRLNEWQCNVVGLIWQGWYFIVILMMSEERGKICIEFWQTW